MSPEAPASRKERLLAGSAATALGVFGLVMMYRHPEGLRVPAWVGFPAMSTFVWGGSAILLREHEKTRGLADGAVLLTIVGLFVPAAWIAFGPGPSGVHGDAGLLPRARRRVGVPRRVLAKR